MLQMPIRSLALKTAALLTLATMSFPVAHAAAGIATDVVLTITTPGTISYGEDVAGYAVVTSIDGSLPSGTVTFFDGAVYICTIPVTQTTSCPPSAGTGFAAGTHMLTAVYSGDATHLGSTSNWVSVTVLPDVTTVSPTSSANPATYGQSMVFTAAAWGGVATLSTAALGAGSDAISANYAGSADAAASSSAPLTEVVNASSITGQSPFTVTVTGAATVDTGRMVNLLVTVAPRAGSIQPVELSCAGLPSESACTFGTVKLPVNGGTTSLQISTMAPHDCGSATSHSQDAGMPFTGPALAGLILLFLPRRQRKSLRGLSMVLVAACGIATLAGCGNCTDLGTRPGDYAIKVIGTSTGASASTVVAKVILHVTVF